MARRPRRTARKKPGGTSPEAGTRAADPQIRLARDPSLNTGQNEAADHKEGPMLVLAGPGTGKTKTLAERYVRLMADGIAPGSILCVTFTRKAAQQLKDRISAATGLPPERVTAGTFHSVVKAVAGRIPEAFPEISGKRLLEESEASAIFRRLCQTHPMDEDDAAERVSGYKDRLMDPKAAAAEAAQSPGAEGEILRRAAAVYADYQKALAGSDLIDFGDLIMGGVLAMREDDELADAISSQFRHLMIDEYQDLNPAQHALIDLFLSAHDNLWAVGDDDQSLYSWRHADVAGMLDFAKLHPGTKTVRLTENYRSRPAVLKAANALVSKNHRRTAKALVPTRTGGSPIRVHEARTADAEAEWIARRIASSLAEGQDPREIAVLARVGHLLGGVERALTRHKIPVKIVGAPPFWELPAVRQALSLVQALASGVRFPLSLDVAPRWTVDKLLGRQRTKAFLQTVRLVCNELHENPPKRYPEEKRAAWRHAIGQLLAEAEAHPEAQEMCALIAQNARSGDGKDAVTACTIHGAKGLEWREVYVVGWEKGVMPHARCEDLEEERRLAYVAVTRAKDRLALTFSAERLRKDTTPSPFLDELLSGLQPSEIERSKGGTGPA